MNFTPDDWRTANAVIMFVAFVATIAWWARYTHNLTPVRTLRMMSLTMFCFTGSYGSFEIAHMTTEFRLPMVTFTGVIAIIAAFVPEDYAYEKKVKDGQQQSIPEPGTEARGPR